MYFTIWGRITANLHIYKLHCTSHKPSVYHRFALTLWFNPSQIKVSPQMRVAAVHVCLKLLCMVCALPNVTSRVLVVGFRLGVAEQHIFQCGVFLYPRTTAGRTWRQTELCACWFSLRFQLRGGLQPNLAASLLYCPGDVIRTPISIPWMTFDRRSVAGTPPTAHV